MRYLRKILAMFMMLILLSTMCNMELQPVQASDIKIGLNRKHVVLEQGQKFQLKVKLKNFKIKNVKWSSNNKSVVTVSSKGKIVAKKKGKAKITVKAGKRKAVCNVSVIKKNGVSNKASKVAKEKKEQEEKKDKEKADYEAWEDWLLGEMKSEFYSEKPISLFRGESYDLKKEVPYFADEVMEKHRCRIFFKSTSETAITVDENGIVTAKNPGKVAVAYKIVEYKDDARTIVKNYNVVKYFRIVSCPDENPSYIVPEVDTEKCGTVNFWRSVVPIDYIKSLFHGKADDMIDRDIDCQIETILAPGNYYQLEYMQWSLNGNFDQDAYTEQYFQGDDDMMQNLINYENMNIILPSSSYIGLQRFPEKEIFGVLDYDKEGQIEYIAIIKEKIQEFQNLVSGCSTDYEKVQLIADKMADEWEYKLVERNPENKNLWSVFVLQETVCAGYAEAEYMILNSVGIPAVYVITGNGEWVPDVDYHAVVYAKIDSTWYGSDITWYDTGADERWMLYNLEDVEQVDARSKYEHTPIDEYAQFIPQI